METNLSITTGRLEEIIQQLQAPRQLPAANPSFDAPGRTGPPSKPSRPAKGVEASNTRENTPVKINLPVLDSDHWLIRVLKISWASFNLSQQKISPGDFYTAAAAGLDSLSNELDQDYYEMSIRDIVKEACEQPDLLLDPESRIRRMQKRVTDIEQTYSTYIQAYGYPTPTVTFNANDAYSDTDDLVEDQSPTRPALPAFVPSPRAQAVQNQYSNGRSTASKTRHEQSSTEVKAEPVDNKARYGRSTASKTRHEQSSTKVKAEPVEDNKARSTALKTRYQLDHTETKAQPVAKKYSHGNRIPYKTRYEKESTERKAESSSRISKTARDLGSSVISRSRQQRRRSSGTKHQAAVEDVASRQSDAVDSSLFEPPDLDNFERDVSGTGAPITDVLEKLAEGDQQERRRRAGERQESEDATPINISHQAPLTKETLPKAEESSMPTLAALTPYIPGKGISPEAVSPKLPAKKAATKETGPKQSIPKTIAPKAILPRETLPARNFRTGALPEEIPAKENPPKKSAIQEVPPKKRPGKHVRIITPPRSLNLRSDDNYIVSTNRIRGDAHSNGQTAGQIFLTVFPEGARTLPTSSQGLRCGIHAMAKYISMLCPNSDEAAVRSQLLGVALRDPLLKAVDESRSGFDQIHLDHILQEWNRENNMQLRLCIVLESDQVNPDGSFMATLHIPGVENQREDLEPTSPIRTVFIHNDNVEMIAPGRGFMNHWRALTSVSGPTPTLPPIQQPIRVSAYDSLGQQNAADDAASQPAPKADASDTPIDKPTGTKSAPGDEYRMQDVQETGQGLVLPESGGPLPVSLQVASADDAHGVASIISAGGFGSNHKEFEASADTHMSMASLPESCPVDDTMDLEKTEMPGIEHTHRRHDSGPGMSGIEFTESRTLQQQIGTREHRVDALPTTTEVEMGNAEAVEGSGHGTPHDHDSLFSSPPKTPPSMRAQGIAPRPASPRQFSPMQVQGPSSTAKELIGLGIDRSISPMKTDGGEGEDAGVAWSDVPILNPIDNAQLLGGFGALTIDAKHSTARLPPPPQCATFAMPDAPSYERSNDAYNVVLSKSDAESRGAAKPVGAIVETLEYNPYVPMVQHPLQQFPYASSNQPGSEPRSGSQYNPYAEIIEQQPQQSLYPPLDQPPAQQEALPQSAAHYDPSALMEPESYQQLLSYTYGDKSLVQAEAESQLALHSGQYVPIEQQRPQQSSYPSPDQPSAQPDIDPQLTSLPPLQPLSSDSDLSSIDHELLLSDPMEAIRIQHRFDSWVKEAHEQWKELDHDAFRDRGLVRYADNRIEDVSDDMKDRKILTMKELEDAIQIAEEAMLRANDAAMDARSAANNANQESTEPGQEQLDEFVRRAYDREERRESRAATKVSGLTARARKAYDLEQKWDAWADAWDPRLEGLFRSTLGTERESQVRKLIKNIEDKKSDVLSSDFVSEKDLAKACEKFEQNLGTLEKMAKGRAPRRTRQGQAAAADEQEQKKKNEEVTARLMTKYGTKELRTIQDALLQQADALAQKRQTEAKARTVFPYASPKSAKGPNLFNMYVEWCRVPHQELVSYINALPELLEQMRLLQDLSLPLDKAVALAEESLDDLAKFHQMTNAHDWKSKGQMQAGLTETTWKLRLQLKKLVP
ncbi:hypothetical protein DV737_g1329, partial [Chaetothyriales sp. CBS 132003]